MLGRWVVTASMGVAQFGQSMINCANLGVPRSRAAFWADWRTCSSLVSSGLVPETTRVTSL